MFAVADLDPLTGVKVVDLTRILLSKGVLRRTPLNPLALAEVNPARALLVAVALAVTWTR
jgi:hypothetical protein